MKSIYCPPKKEEIIKRFGLTDLFQCRKQYKKILAVNSVNHCNVKEIKKYLNRAPTVAIYFSNCYLRCCHHLFHFRNTNTLRVFDNNIATSKTYTMFEVHVFLCYL